MSDESKGRGRPIPDASITKLTKHIHYEISRAMSLEKQYESNLLIAHLDQQPDAVALPSRDGAVQILRCLKVWFDLPSIVFLTSVNVLDRFLSKMVVRQKFLACVSISCLKIATDIHRCPINTSNLVSISQSKCKVQDVERMSEIIRSKLGLETLTQPVTAYTFLTLFLRCIDCIATQLEVKPYTSRLLSKKVLARRLEVVMGNSKIAGEMPSVIALCLIQSEVERFMKEDTPIKSPYCCMEMWQFLTITLVHLQNVCRIVPDEYTACYENMKNILGEYDNHNRSPYSQSLQWRFSISTLNTPKPLEMFYTNLDTIRED